MFPALFLIFKVPSLIEGAIALCWVGATLCQLGIWGRLLARGWRRTTPPILPELPPPAVSVVVCVRNEAENLRTRLPVLLTQQYEGAFELLVIDDASTDETPAVLAALEQKYPSLRILRVPEKTAPGKKQALAMGIAAARYDWLLLTDADCRPAGPHWIQHMMLSARCHPEPDMVLGYGPFEAEKGFLNTWARFEVAYTALQYLAFARWGHAYMGVGRNLAWKKALFEKNGGFSAHAGLASGDDDLFVNAAAQNGTVATCTDRQAFVYSPAPSNWSAWWQQKRRHLSTGLHYRPAHRYALGLIALTHTLHYGLGFLFLYNHGWMWALYVVRLSLAARVYARAFRLLDERSLLCLLPLWDGMLALYYGLLAPWGVWGKSPKYKWR